jgi:translation initiation factor 1
MKKSNKKKRKQRTGIVYSTNPEFQYTHNDLPEKESLPPEQQTLYVAVDRKSRKGKIVTLILGFVGSSAEQKELARRLKSTCNTGGSVKGDEILIQGYFRIRIIQILTEAGYKTKRKGG